MYPFHFSKKRQKRKPWQKQDVNLSQNKCHDNPLNHLNLRFGERKERLKKKKKKIQELT